MSNILKYVHLKYGGTYVKLSNDYFESHYFYCYKTLFPENFDTQTSRSQRWGNYLEYYWLLMNDD